MRPYIRLDDRGRGEDLCMQVMLYSSSQLCLQYCDESRVPRGDPLTNQYGDLDGDGYPDRVRVDQECNTRGVGGCVWIALGSSDGLQVETLWQRTRIAADRHFIEYNSELGRHVLLVQCLIPPEVIRLDYAGGGAGETISSGVEFFWQM
jgi:hypothetical protein